MQSHIRQLEKYLFIFSYYSVWLLVQVAREMIFSFFFSWIFTWNGTSFWAQISQVITLNRRLDLCLFFSVLSTGIINFGKPRLSLTKQKFANKVFHNTNPNCHRKEYKGPQQTIKNNKILQSIIRKAWYKLLL